MAHQQLNTLYAATLALGNNELDMFYYTNLLWIVWEIARISEGRNDSSKKEEIMYRKMTDDSMQKNECKKLRKNGYSEQKDLCGKERDDYNEEK